MADSGYFSIVLKIILYSSLSTFLLINSNMMYQQWLTFDLAKLSVAFTVNNEAHKSSMGLYLGKKVSHLPHQKKGLYSVGLDLLQ